MIAPTTVLSRAAGLAPASTSSSISARSSFLCPVSIHRSNLFGKGSAHGDVQEEGRRTVPAVTGGRTLAAGAARVAAACDTRGGTVLPNISFEQTEQKVYSHLVCGGNADLHTGPVTGAGTLSCAAGTFGAILTDHTQTRPSHTV